MLSDEEKEVIEKIQKGNKIGIYELIRTFKREGIENFITVRRKYIDIMINLIEKQSKEIEELKQTTFKRSDMCFLLKSENTKLKAEIKALENADLTAVYLNGVYDGEKKANDKIKAKIEVLEKEEKEALKGTKGQDRYAIKQEYMYKRSGLQSLLEKE